MSQHKLSLIIDDNQYDVEEVVEFLNEEFEDIEFIIETRTNEEVIYATGLVFMTYEFDWEEREQVEEVNRALEFKEFAKQ